MTSVAEHPLRIPRGPYRVLFIVQDRAHWAALPFAYDPAKDLVLTFDFAVAALVRAAGGTVQYFDHIVDTAVVEGYNHRTYAFFASWHRDKDGRDIFAYKGVETASALRIEIWNDLTFYVRLFVNAAVLFDRLRFQRVYCGADMPFLSQVLEKLGIACDRWSPAGKADLARTYFFPIFRWMEQALRPAGFKNALRRGILGAVGLLSLLADRFAGSRHYLFIEWYHPTSKIIDRIKRDGFFTIVRSEFLGWRDVSAAVQLPVRTARGRDTRMTRQMLERFDCLRCSRLVIEGRDISGELYRLILSKARPLLGSLLRSVDIIDSFFKRRNLSLMVTIASIGVVNRLMINFCEARGIPVFMIINGWLGNDFLDEAKNGTWINAYSPSIRANYFKGMQERTLCLGDPRMDEYAASPAVRRPAASRPVIGIGASGFTNVDLNCYLAIEFEFLNDILLVLRRHREQGRQMDVLLKIRQNGYLCQYQVFLKEYFPEMPVKLVGWAPMMQIYRQCDFFVSIYSQSLFEASVIGLPVVYYKNDTQVFQPPFDGASELVTACDRESLFEKIGAMYAKDPLFDAFRRREVLEKYIGPLDGKNLQRNMDQIYSLCRR